MSSIYSRIGMDKKAPLKSNDDDVYEGYEDLNANTEVIINTITAKKPDAARTGSSAAVGAVITTAAAAAPGTDPTARPMTSVRAAGYSSSQKPAASVAALQGSDGKFDPLQQAVKAPSLISKTQDNPEQQAREMEKQVNKAMEESAAANVKGDYQLALEKAKEAGKKERLLCKHREKNGMAEQINYDLTYAVCFNLANQYHAAGMLQEALNTYSVVVKNKQYPQAGRLRVNMGNIYFDQKKYPAAIKMYRMAMDQVGNTSREMKYKIMRNIGVSFLKLGQFQDAIQSFESIMEGFPDPQTGFNLVVSYYAVGDKDKMKRSFSMLLNVVQQQDTDEEEDEDEDEKDKKEDGVDELKAERRARKKLLHRYVLMAAKLIAPVIEKMVPAGYDWLIESLKSPKLITAAAAAAAAAAANGNNNNNNNNNANNNPNQQPPAPGSPLTGSSGAKSIFRSVGMELEIAKGIAFLKRKQISDAIEVFKGFERKDQGLIDQAATNLSFLYFLEGDMKNAEKYADLAVKADRYNARALVNKANYVFARGELEAAKEMYLEAIGVEADCVEAIYNLGLVNKRLGNLEDSLQAFKKLHRIIPRDPQVVCQIALLYEMLDDTQSAIEWFKILHGVIPTDPKVLYRLGMLYHREEDETQASHNFLDSYNVYPVSMDVISWLGVWFVKGGNYDQAIQFFERAAEIAPDDVKWKLMVASCYRRNDDIHKALAIYKEIHKQEPENLECLRYLTLITKDLQDPAWEDYNKALKKIERTQQTNAQPSAFMQGEVPQDNEMKSASSAPNNQGNENTPSTSPLSSPRNSAAFQPPPSSEQPNVNPDPNPAMNSLNSVSPNPVIPPQPEEVKSEPAPASAAVNTSLSPRAQNRTINKGQGGGDDDDWEETSDMWP